MSLEAGPRRGLSRVNDIRAFSQYQRNWRAVIEPLRRGRFLVEDLETRSIHGDAPKNFIRIKEYVPGRSGRRIRNWPGYIAKVGYKNYPNESITEQLLTRVGQLAGVNIADSMLRMVAEQVRFLSKYFLSNTGESLVHGIEIFKQHLKDDRLVEAISIRRAEREFYSFQVVCAAIKDTFPEQFDTLIAGVVEMLAFDALVGNNDRHPLNWGVIVPVSLRRSPRFGPVFDTARALFWNVSETKVSRMRGDQQSLRAYVERSIPQIGWDGHEIRSHFDLIQLLCQEHPELRANVGKFLDEGLVPRISRMIEAEFQYLMTYPRRRLIVDCLDLRQRRLAEVVN